MERTRNGQMSARKRGRPFKSDDDLSKKVNFLKKPKYLADVKKDEKVEQFLNHSSRKKSEPDTNRARPSRSSSRRKKASFLSSRRKRSTRSTTSVPTFKNVSSSAYYQQFKSYKSSSYDYSGLESCDEFDNSDDDSSSFNEVEDTSLVDNLSESESTLSDDGDSDSDYSLSTSSKKSGGPNPVTLGQMLMAPDPICLQNRSDIPSLTLPFSSNDLLLEKPYLMDAISIYEVLRRFSSHIRLSPFRFEDFCACLVLEDQSVLLVEIHVMLLKALIREDDSQQTTLTVPDQKDSVNISLYLIDPLTWPEVLRLYVESDQQFDQNVLDILNRFEYPFVPVSSRIEVLQFLIDQFLITSPVRDDFNNDVQHHAEDYCRVCHKLGNLLCCDTCTASFHLDCIDPPMYEVPDSDWQCILCKLQTVEGVSDCQNDQDGETSRITPLGYDRHGRKYYFIVRRIIVESLDGDEVWYYSIKEEFDNLLECLDLKEFEENLVTVLNEKRDEILKQMAITIRLTNNLKNGRKSYLDSLKELMCSIKRKQDTNFDWNTSEEKVRLDQINVSPFFYKLGVESSCKQYVNQYSVNSVALNKPQRNEERDKKRYLSHKFSLTPASEFKWAGQVYGSKTALVTTLRHTISFFENAIPMIFMHVNWPYLRKTWLHGVTASLMPADFSRILLILESCMKRVVFANVWHEQAGHLKLQRMTVVDRDERKKTEKREKRERDEEEEKNRLAYNFVKYTVRLKHQVWKQKGEEYRIHGQWGWLWLSSAYRLKECKSITKGLNVNSCQRLIQVEDQDGKTKHLVLSRDLYEYFVNYKPPAVQIKKEASVDYPITDVPLKNEPMEDGAQQSEETRSSSEDNNDIKEEPISENAKDDNQNNQKSPASTDTFAQKFINYKIIPLMTEFDEIDVSLSLSSNRVPYPKIAKKSKLDDLLSRRIQLKVIEEHNITKVKENNAIKDSSTSNNNGDSKSSENNAQKPPLRPEVVAAITKRIQLLRAKYSFVAKSLSKYKCYSYSCTADKNTVLLVSQSCYSPVCMLRTRLRKELLILLKEINYQASSIPRIVTSGFGFNKKNSILEHKLRQKSLQQKVEVVSVEDMEKQLCSALDSTLVFDFEKFQTAFIPKKDVCDENVSEIKEEIKAEEAEIKTEAACTSREETKSTSSKAHRIVDGIVQIMESKSTSKSKPADLGTCSRINRRFNSEPKTVQKEEKEEKAVDDERDKREKADSGDKDNGESGCKVKEPERIYSTTSTSGKIYLKKVEVADKKRIIPIKIPTPSQFVTKKGTYNILVLPRHALLKLAKKGGKCHVSGYHNVSKSIPINWPYPCQKPLFKTCWLYRTVTLKSIAAACLQLRILWTCIRWDDLEAKPPPDGKNQIQTENETITYEILNHRTLGEFLDRTQYLRKKEIVPLESPIAPRTPTMREITSIRLGLRKRKRPDSPQITEPQTIEEWVDEEKIEMWELRLYAERHERSNNQVITRSRTGNLPPTRISNEMVTVDKNRTVLSRILAAPLNSSLNKSVVTTQSLQQKQSSMVGKSSDEIREKLENDLRLQREALHNKRNSELRNSGQIISVLSTTNQNNNMNDTKLRLINRIRLNSENQTLQNLLQNDPNKLGAAQIIVKNPDGTTKVYHTVNANSLSTPQTTMKSNNVNKTVSTSNPSPSPSPSPKIKVVKNAATGQLEIYGLASNQHAVPQPDGSIHIITKSDDNLIPNRSSPQVVTVRQINPPTPAPKMSKQAQLKAEEETLLLDQPPGSIARRITVQVIETPQGHGILTQGLQFNEYTPKQLTDIQLQIKNKLQAAQTMAGTQLIKDPLEMIILIKPDTSSEKVKVIQQPLPEVTPDAIVQLPEAVDSKVAATKTEVHPMPKLRHHQEGLQIQTQPKMQQLSQTPSSASINNVILNNHLTETNLNQMQINVKEKLKETVQQKSLGDQKLPNVNHSYSDSLSHSSSTPSATQTQTHQNSQSKRNASMTKKRLFNSLRDDTDYVPGPTNTRKYIRKKYTYPNTSETDEEDLFDNNDNDDDDDDYEKNRSNLKYRSDSDSETASSVPSSKFSLERNNNDSATNNLPKDRRNSIRKDTKKLSNRKNKKPPPRKQPEAAEVEVTSDTEGDFSCYCQIPYDETKFYVGCDICHKWFHGDCIGIDEKKSKTMHHFVCNNCECVQSNKLYCLCREPYDDNQFYICCDKCQDWFHGRCVCILQSEAPEIDVYICPNCQENSSFLKVNRKTLTDEDFEDLSKLLRQLQTHKNSWPFREPVKTADVPDYYNIIKNPMDLQTLETKLSERAYVTLSDFLGDAVKIFDNCRYFNPKETSFYKCAESLEAFFVNKLKFVREKLLERLQQQQQQA